MKDLDSVVCPFCGQSCTLEIETSYDPQRFVTDCEVCCRPFEVTVICQEGRVMSIDAQSE